MKKILTKIKNLSNQTKFWICTLLCIIPYTLFHFIHIENIYIQIITLFFYTLLMFKMVKYAILDAIKIYKDYKNGN